MSKSGSYEVIPEKAARVVTVLEDPEFSAGGCLAVGFISYLAIGVISMTVYAAVTDSSKIPVPLMGASLVCGLILGPLYGIHSRSRKRQVALEEKAKLEATLFARATEEKKKEALRLTEKCRGFHDQGLAVARRLPSLLKNAEASLNRARSEFDANAFGPYWDQVESGVNHIGAFKEGVEELAELSSDYHATLADRRHTFPAFPVGLNELPSPAPVLRELARVVRMGQTNYQFANIWEHRKTREVLVEGFNNLGDAVLNLGSSVAHAVSELGSELGTGLQQLTSQNRELRLDAQRHSERQHFLLEDIRSAVETQKTESGRR